MSNQKKTLLIIGVILCVISIGFYVFSISYLRGHMKETRVLALTIDSINEHRTNILQLKKAVSQTRAEKKELAELFVHEDEIVEFLSFFEGLAETAGVEIELAEVDIAGGNGSGEEKIGRLNMSFSTNGNFTDTYHFIRLVEESPFEMVFSSALLTLRQQQQSSPDESLTADSNWSAKFTVFLNSFITAGS